MTTTFKTAAWIALGLAFLATSASGQSTYGYQTQTGYGIGYVPYYGGIGYGYGPATAAESYYRGYADLVRAWGHNNYYNSMAQVYWEQAREKAIANRTARVEQFFALRKLNAEQRFGTLAKKRLSKEQLVSLSKKAAPKRLSDEHWTATGEALAWPSALKTESFAAQRKQLDRLFRNRRDNHRLADNEIAQAESMVDSMLATLREAITTVEPGDYVAAKRFLNTLRYEVKLNPSVAERLAQR